MIGRTGEILMALGTHLSRLVLGSLGCDAETRVKGKAEDAYEVEIKYYMGSTLKSLQWTSLGLEISITTEKDQLSTTR